MRIDISDLTLFGNDAAEDESEGVFESYFLDRSDYARFVDPASRLCVARAYKGEGKSALLRYAETAIANQDPESLRISTTASGMSVQPKGNSPDDWVRAWKLALLGHIAGEVGARIGFALSDDAISLVEEAEKNGFRQKNLVSSILDRIKPKIKDLSIDLSKIGVSYPERVLSRSPHSYAIWLFVDDLDLNFENTTESKAKIAGMFTACRQLVNQIPHLHIRASIRPNVWAIVRRDAEAMSHVEQYMLDVQWQTVDLRNLLARRIEGYLSRTKQTVPIDKSKNRQTNEENLINLAFENEMNWGFVGGEQKRRPPHVVLSTLSRHRPRWLVELCKEAAKRAYRRESSVITLADITNCLESFGERRMSDTVVEFRSMCPDIEDILAAFVGQSEDFKTDQLVQLLRARVLDHVSVRITGSNGTATPLQIAQLLYQIGFITARMEAGDGQYEHYSFADKPELLKSKTNVDQGFSWEIHPVFRQILQIRDTSGAARRRRTRG